MPKENPGPAFAGIELMAIALVMMAIAKAALAIFFELLVMIFSPDVLVICLLL